MGMCTMGLPTGGGGLDLRGGLGKGGGSQGGALRGGMAGGAPGTTGRVEVPWRE